MTEDVFRFLSVMFGSWGLLVIFIKYKGFDKLMLIGNMKKIKLLYALGNCEFCVWHHLAVIPLIIFDLSTHFEVYHIFIPFLSVSFLNFIKSIKYGN